MFDFYAACNALALRYAPGTIGTPTSEPAMRASYAQMPNNISVSPCVFISPQEGEMVYGAGDKRGEYQVDVNFCLAKASGDYTRMETSRQRWLPILLGATDGKMTLGISGVQKAIPTRWEYRQIVYGDDTWDGITLHVTIYTDEPVTLVP